MNRNRRFKTHPLITLTAIVVVAALIVTIFSLSQANTKAAGAPADPIAKMYQRAAPDYDLNTARQLPNLRHATGEQINASQALRAAVNAPEMKIRWNDFGGSPDMMMDFASQPFSGTPEAAARAFLNQNAALFGITNANNFRVFSQKAALGGYMVRFQQVFNGVPVTDGGIGVVMNKNKQVIMVSGPFFRDVNVSTQPTLNAASAKQIAGLDLQQFNLNLSGAVANLLQNGLGFLNQQASAIDNLQPQLGIYPTADGYRLVWKVAKFSTNPFGLYMTTIDAHTGEIIARKDFVNFQLPNLPSALPLTADIYPKYPTITDELKNQGIISVCGNAPCGQERVKLRKFDQTNIVTGLNGTLTGTNTIVNNLLPTKLPFAQAAKGTWHFREDNTAGLEARTNELDQFAEPAEHQDEINAFFFTTYLLEYVDNLHIGSDQGTFGSQGSFPDDYPNKTVPLPATVHMPNIYIALQGTTPDPSDPDLAKKVLGMDNAFALNLTSIIESVTAAKSPVVVNPTFYGHGFYFNDLALEGTVPYHEGMHAITSPIAGLEGTEGGALNEGQADMWAFTITDTPNIGEYVVNAHGIRQRYRDLNRDPDSIAYIRSARSTLKYSDIGTLLIDGAPAFEEHYDGEIYMSTMWDIREMFNRMYPEATTYKRPRPSDGQALKPITKGTHIFERDFLGSMYVLGTTAPDTMVKARDAMIVADQMLYPADASDADSPGKHRAMIEQIFAAHEMGINALEVTGDRATISTQVSVFAGNQAAPAVPEQIAITAASARSLKVSWKGVPGAVAYEVLKRRDGFAGAREPNGRREYADGDAATTGFRHVAFVNGDKRDYEDKGAVHEIFAPAGLSNLFDHEYVVRAIGVNTTGQLGFSSFSESVRPHSERQDLTAQVDSAIANISFAGGVMSFDNKLTNARGALSADKTIYAPLEFKITGISNPAVTVKNADANGDTFIFNQVLALGTVSAAKRLEFNDPGAQMFSFDAEITGSAFGGTSSTGGPAPGDGSSEPPQPVSYAVFREEKTGTLLLGDPTGGTGVTPSVTWGDPAFQGITWQDIPVTTKGDALQLKAALSSVTAVDLDFELRTQGGQVLSESATATAAETVSAHVQPNTTYILRVKGFANGPATFTINCEQLLPSGSPNGNTAEQRSAAGSAASGKIGATVNKIRFTIDPQSRKVTFKILK